MASFPCELRQGASGSASGQPSAAKAKASCTELGSLWEVKTKSWRRFRAACPNRIQGSGCIIHLNIATCKWWVSLYLGAEKAIYVSNGCKMGIFFEEPCAWSTAQTNFRSWSPGAWGDQLLGPQNGLPTSGNEQLLRSILGIKGFWGRNAETQRKVDSLGEVSSTCNKGPMNESS